jgi:hypothetical protein
MRVNSYGLSYLRIARTMRRARWRTPAPHDQPNHVHGKTRLEPYSCLQWPCKIESKSFEVVYSLNKGGHTTLVTSPEYRGVATIVHWVYHLRIFFSILQGHCKQLYSALSALLKWVLTDLSAHTSHRYGDTTLYGLGRRNITSHAC